MLVSLAYPVRFALSPFVSAEVRPALCMLSGGILEEFVVLIGVGRCANSVVAVLTFVCCLGGFWKSLLCSLG